MNYTEPLLNQVSRFLMSMGFGFILCILYLTFSFIRMMLGEKRWAYIVTDILFGIIATVLSFFFMLIYNNGQVRLNLVVGQLTGGMELYFTVGRYLLKPMGVLSHAVRKTGGIVFLPVMLFFKSFPCFFKRLFNSIKEKRHTSSTAEKENLSVQKQKRRKKRKNKKENKKYSENTLEKSA